MTHVYTFKETQKDYLTEKSLGDALEVLFPDTEIIHNKNHKDLGFRPDYVIPTENLIVEFNGFGHYTNNKIVEQDYHKRMEAESLGIRTISIPYFIQLDSRMIHHYFGKDSNDFNDYPYGFVDKKAVLPGQFSSLGLNRFIAEYRAFRYDVEDGEKIVIPILMSLVQKYMSGKHTFLECFPFVVDEFLRDDMEYGLYGFLSDKELEYFVACMNTNLAMIRDNKFYG